MIFNSLTFLVFLAIVLAVHRLGLSWRIKKFNLLVASYIFYAAWNPPFVGLLALSTLVDWFAAKQMAVATGRAKRVSLLMLSLCVNLGLLGFFKYGNFMLDSFVGLLATVGIAYHPARLDIILPVGISFYTFQTLSYTIDVYRGSLKPSRSFLDFAMYVSFFPQLVAGPIVRAADFLPQCAEPRQATSRQMGWGLCLLTIGLFEKMILADTILAPVADAVYTQAHNVGTLDAWAGTLAFAGQIFFDFSGYSTCAIGVGMCLGFVLPDNFRLPYAAIGLSDFWRRWHISLSTWLRDYLYIPLGGNRKGTGRAQANVMVTMLLGGLWHGAAWRFIAWGGIHGVYLVIERMLRRRFGQRQWVSYKLVRIALAGITFFLVCITWVFFRAQSFSSAFGILRSMLLGSTHTNLRPAYEVLPCLAVVFAMVAGHWLMRDTTIEQVAARVPWWVRSGAIAVLLFLLALAPGNDNAFIYFQF